MNIIKHGGLEGDGGLVVLFSIVAACIIVSWLTWYFSDYAIGERELKRQEKKYKKLYAVDDFGGCHSAREWKKSKKE